MLLKNDRGIKKRKKYNALANRFDEAKIRLKEAEDERLQRTARKKELEV